MPAWTIVDARTGMAETIEADRIERGGSGWSWWTVVVVIHDPWWCCVRRVGADQIRGQPHPIGRGQHDAPGEGTASL